MKTSVMPMHTAVTTPATKLRRQNAMRATIENAGTPTCKASRVAAQANARGRQSNSSVSGSADLALSMERANANLIDAGDPIWIVAPF